MKELLNIYFGVIGNEDIENVKAQDAKNCNVYKEAKIIDTGEIRIWLVYMEGLKGSQFDVVGLSKDEKELTRVSEVVVYSILCSTNNTSMFFKSNINSIFNNQFWFSITFIQYIILTVVCVYILSIITAFISMFVWRKVSSYVVGIGVQVPIVFILGQLTVRLLLNNLTFMYNPKYLAFGVYIILIIVVVALVYKCSKKEIIKDI